MKITPCIAFDNSAADAAAFYVAAFSQHTPASIDVEVPNGIDNGIASAQINIGGANIGTDIVLLNIGPTSKITPANSFMVNFDPQTNPQAEAQMVHLWETLNQGGTERMPLQEYPFSKKFGWVEDRFGVNWQLMMTSPDSDPRPHIVPSFLFTGPTPHTREALKLWGSLLPFEMGQLIPSPEDPSGESVMFSDFRLVGDWFTAMDGGDVHKFGFEVGFSLMVNCDSQEQVDRIWEGLSADPEAERCGWLKDKFGFSWQILPPGLLEKLQNPANVEKMLHMKKIDINQFD